MEKSTHLIFTKQLKPSHIDYALSFPTAVLGLFPIPEGGHRIAFEVVDTTGISWEFCLSTRLRGLYPKPVILRSSWHPFVAQKGLIPNDRVMFYRERDGANEVMRFRIRAQRNILTLMGQDVWVDVENLHLYHL